MSLLSPLLLLAVTGAVHADKSRWSDNAQDNFQDSELPFFLSEMALDFTKTVCLNKVESPTFAFTIS